MFKYVYFLLALILIGCNSKELKNFKIQGNISGAENKMYYLYALGDTIPLLLDSAYIENTELNFNTILIQPYTLLGLGASQQNLMLLIAEPEDKLTITASQPELPFKYAVEGSNNSMILQKYVHDRSLLYIENDKIQKKLKLLSYDAQEERDQLIQSAFSIKEKFNSLKYKFIETNKKSPAIFIALFDIVDNTSEYNYLKIIESSINEFFPQTVFSREINLRVKKAELEKTNLAKHEAIIEQQKQEMINSGIEIGKEAPELNFPSINGHNISLSSLKGKIVLLDFWASWCGPCRKENPFVVSLYNKYKDKGFDIYSFSLDKKKEKWGQAIKQDGLIWNNHVSDLMGWQSVGASKYMIRSIPQTFLIDKNGKIIDIGLRGVQLEKRLKELLET